MKSSTNVPEGQRHISLNPDSFTDDLGSLLGRGETEQDFKDAETHKAAEPVRCDLHCSLVGAKYGVKTEANRRSMAMAAVRRIATRLGLAELHNLAEWKPLREAFHRQAVKAHRGRDKEAIDFFESREAVFRFVSSTSRRMTVFLYPRVAVEIDDAADVLGLSKTKTILVCLMLGLSTSPEWAWMFTEDLEAFQRHLKRRLGHVEAEV